MKPSLRAAIENVYAAFSDVKRPTSVDGCPCCIDGKGITILLSKPLRDLSPAELTHYASSALLTVGSAEDFVYFLPRIMEILITESHWWPDPQVVALAIRDAGLPAWSNVRREALLRYLREVFSEVLGRNYLAGHKIDSWTCAIGIMQFDLIPFLQRIAEQKAQLLDWFDWNSGSLTKKNTLASRFWDDAPPAKQQVIDWFHSPEIKAVIFAAYGYVT